MIDTVIKIIYGGIYMSQDFNLYEVWKDLYTQSSVLFDKQVKDDFPSQGVGQALDMNLQFKKMMNEATDRYLEFVNLPTKNDLANISSLIVNVDAKVDDLEEMLEEKGNQEAPVALQNEIATLKKDMKNFDTKLNQILTLLKDKN